MKATTLLIVALAACLHVAVAPPPPPPGSPDIPEECRPKPPKPGKERTTCCEMPISREHDKFKDVLQECKEVVIAAHPNVKPPNHPPPPPPPAGGAPPPPPPPAGGAPPPPPPPAGGAPPPPPHHHGPPPHQKLFMECMDECFFNKSGLLTKDMKLNLEPISKLAAEFVKSDSAWKPIADEAIKTCVEKANSAKDEGECKRGPHEFSRCIMREMYMKCPAGVWQDNDECKAEKEQMEKCPNMMPRPPHRPHHVKKD